MSKSGLVNKQLVHGPNLLQRLVLQTSKTHRQAVVSSLQRLRAELESGIESESWVNQQVSIVLLLADVCSALSLSDSERASVLGKHGEQAFMTILGTQIKPCFHNRPERQAKALAYVQRRDRINLSDYRQICPGWSDETLRLDLANLVEQGVLARHGITRWTYYTQAASS